MALMLRMRRWPCWHLICQLKLPLCPLCITMTKSLVNYRTYNTTNCWRCVDTHAQNGAVTMLVSLLPINAANTSVMHKTTKSLLNNRPYKSTNCWRSVDAHFTVWSMQHLLPSIIVYNEIWLYWLSFCLIETWPCGKAEQHNYLALFTFTSLKMMHHAKRFIAAAIHLLMNQDSQATYHLPKIYL
jgi:hypothetical protein